jgi:hypothetical protein
MTETQRIILRTRALGALKDAILPAFCEGLACDKTCPFYINKLTDCLWMQTCECIDQMMEKV